MKAKTFILRDSFILSNAKIELDKIELDGRTQVTISNVGTKSSRQHGLWWLWCTDVSDSGMGSYDTKDGVHLAAKKRWVTPLLRRDDPFFCELYNIYSRLYGKDIDKMDWFTRHQVSTSMLSVSQMAEALTDFQRFYLSHGVPLRDPELKLLEMK